MATVRCTRTLLQRTQAAVAEEGRRLVPSRFMRSRQLSSQVSSEHAGKSPALESELDMKMKKLAASMARLKNTPGPDASKLRLMSYGRAANSVVDGAVNFAIFCIISAAVYRRYSEKGVEAQAITKGSS
ncbi:hypothetical protein CFC21_009494 [Triticum aestivum]|uniref:Uncharacterized protein n=2 Tax=Triticum aestivum TaxID=4565 RepID=A0A9R1ITY4_WHEAT|nr:uncharacterized protein LOC119345517 [Triticum dicoccoides]XP_044378844.1 uncharacterized protein LOC123101458 [Triticum aestivum]KAF6992509.1 hypothetical protein CFC21_009494 [Triticum aestivum]